MYYKLKISAYGLKNLRKRLWSKYRECRMKLGDQASVRAFPVFPRRQFLVCASKRITSTRLAEITSPNTICSLGRQSTESVDDKSPHILTYLNQPPDLVPAIFEPVLVRFRDFDFQFFARTWSILYSNYSPGLLEYA